MKIKILNRAYEIKVLETRLVLDNQKNLGLINHDRLAIEIANKQCLQMKIETLLHETVHAISDQMALNFDEDMCDKLSVGLYSMIFDNDWNKIKKYFNDL